MPENVKSTPTVYAGSAVRAISSYNDPHCALSAWIWSASTVCIQKLVVAEGFQRHTHPHDRPDAARVLERKGRDNSEHGACNGGSMGDSVATTNIRVMACVGWAIWLDGLNAARKRSMRLSRCRDRRRRIETQKAVHAARLEIFIIASDADGGLKKFIKKAVKLNGHTIQPYSWVARQRLHMNLHIHSLGIRMGEITNG